MNKLELWNKTIWGVNESIRNIRDIIDMRTTKLGLYDEYKDKTDYGLANMCDELKYEILDLFDKISNIKIQCNFLTKEDIND